MSKKLLIETRMNSLTLNESKSRTVHPGCLGTLDGPCADFRNATRNNNLYRRRLWENVFNDPIVKESLEDRILIGELDHPGDRLETKAVNAAIVMTSYEFDDANGLLLGTFDILDTPNGRILKSLLDYGCKIGVSSRGEGDVTSEDGIDVVDEDSYNFIGFDAVVLPAVKAAKPTLRESLERNSESLRESLVRQVEEATTVEELNLIKKVVEATDLPDSDSLIESVNNKSQELTEGTTGSSNLLEDLEKATRQIGEQSEEIRRLKEELTTCKSKVSRLIKSRQKVLEDLSRQNRRIKDLTSEQSCSAFEFADSSKKVESLQSRLNESSKTISELRRNIRITDSELSKAESRVSSLEESLSKAQEMVRAKSQEVANLTALVEGLKSTSGKKLTESKERGRKVQESLDKAKTSLQSTQKSYSDFIRGYIEDRCKSLGVSPDLVLESVKVGMSKGKVDSLIESCLERSDRYKSLSFTSDPVLGSIGGSVSFNGSQVRVDEELKQTVDFMTEANKLF